jgi:hypothetical protein
VLFNNNHPTGRQGDYYFFPLVIALTKAIIKEISDIVSIDEEKTRVTTSYVPISHHLLPLRSKVVTTPCLSDYLIK